MKKQEPSFPEQIFPEHVGSFMNDFDYNDQATDQGGATQDQDSKLSTENQLDKTSKPRSLNIGAWDLARGKRY